MHGCNQPHTKNEEMSRGIDCTCTHFVVWSELRAVWKHVLSHVLLSPTANFSQFNGKESSEVCSESTDYQILIRCGVTVFILGLCVTGPHEVSSKAARPSVYIAVLSCSHNSIKAEQTVCYMFHAGKSLFRLHGQDCLGRDALLVRNGTGKHL